MVIFKMSRSYKIVAIVPAAGLGSRMNSRLAKPMLEIGGKPIIALTLEKLQAHPLVDRIILVFNRNYLARARSSLKKYRFTKLTDIVAGGATRQASVRNGLMRLGPEDRYVLIHDGVRPFIDEGCISRVIRQARACGAAVAGVPLKPTIKRLNSKSEVEETPHRDCLWEIQTPQVFKRETIESAYRDTGIANATDDASLVEAAGKKVKVVLGSYFNIKITTPEDLVFAEAIVKKREEA